MPTTRSQKSTEVKIKKESKPFAIKQEIKVENVKIEANEDENDVKPNKCKPEKQINENGEAFWKLGRNRRLSVSTYKGVEYVHIRQYYTHEENGQAKPSKTGITLNKQEWLKMLSVQNDVEFKK